MPASGEIFHQLQQRHTQDAGDQPQVQDGHIPLVASEGAATNGRPDS